MYGNRGNNCFRGVTTLLKSKHFVQTKSLIQYLKTLLCGVIPFPNLAQIVENTVYFPKTEMGQLIPPPTTSSPKSPLPGMTRTIVATGLIGN